VSIDFKWLINGRESSLSTVFTWAHAAANANRSGYGHIAEIEPFGVNGAVCVPSFATEAHGKHFAGVIELALWVSDCSRNPQVISAIGHLSQLAGHYPRLSKGFVDIPERAGSARVGKMDAGCRLTL